MLIEPNPEPVAHAETLEVLACWLCITVFAVVPHRIQWSFVGCFVLLAILGSLRRNKHLVTVQLSFYFAVFMASALILEILWLACLGIAIFAYILLVAAWPKLREHGWWRRGRTDRVSIALAVTFTLVAGAALVSWVVLVKPDLSDLTEGMFPKGYSPILVMLGGVLFSMTNAFGEEFAYRGVLMAALERTPLSTPLVILAQGVAFGVLHINGFPRGAIGILLASVYGIMMGTIRHTSRGMLVPWASHVLTDATITAILLFMI